EHDRLTIEVCRRERRLERADERRISLRRLASRNSNRLAAELQRLAVHLGVAPHALVEPGSRREEALVEHGAERVPTFGLAPGNGPGETRALRLEHAVLENDRVLERNAEALEVAVAGPRPRKQHRDESLV